MDIDHSDYEDLPVLADSDSESESGFSNPALKKLRAAVRHHDRELTVEDRETAILDAEMASEVNRDWERVVDLCRDVNPRPQMGAMTFPWERAGVSKVFGYQPILKPPSLIIPSFVSSNVPITEQNTASASEAIAVRFNSVPGAWKAVAKRIQNLQFHVSSDSKRQVALAKWKQILATAPEHSGLGRKLLADLLSLKSDNHIDSVLEDVFSKKATATLAKRGSHLLDYFDFCHKRKEQPLPLSEPHFYAYLRSERATKSATSAKSSKESITFTISTLNLDGAEEIGKSERILGLCHRLNLLKRPTKQSRLMTRRNALTLERTLFNPKSWLPDRIFSGQALWCLYGRLRWSESQFSQGMKLDLVVHAKGGYLESSSLRTKTSTTAQKRTTLLPQVAPADGLEMQNWPSKWLVLRQRAKLAEPGAVDAEGELIPLLPVVGTDGQFGRAPLSSGEASKWLREILSNSLDSDGQSSEGVSSHSLKSTTLAWTSKHGKASPYERKILGYHIDSAESTMLIYSRDALAQPLRVYVGVLLDIATGVFDPDATRSGMFRSTDLVTKSRGSLSFAHEPEVEGSVEEDFVEVVASTLGDIDFDKLALELESSEADKKPIPEAIKISTDSESSSSDTDSDDSSDEDRATRSLAPILVQGRPGVRAPANSACSMKLFHVRLKTLHLVHKTDATKLACGRFIHAGFKIFEVEVNCPSEDYPRCSVCFGKVPLVPSVKPA